MNPKALAIYWFGTVAVISTAIAAPAWFLLPLVVLGIYFLYSIHY